MLRSTWDWLIMWNAIRPSNSLKVHSPLLSDRRLFSFFLVSRSTMTWNDLNYSNTLSVVFRKYTHTFREAWSLKVKKIFASAEWFNLHRTANSECTRLHNSNLFMEETLNETLCWLPNKQWLQGPNVAFLSTLISFFLNKAVNPFSLMWSSLGCHKSWEASSVTLRLFVIIFTWVLYNLPQTCPRAIVKTPLDNFYVSVLKWLSYPCLSRDTTDSRLSWRSNTCLTSFRAIVLPKLVFIWTSPIPAISEELELPIFTAPKSPPLYVTK